MGPYRSAADCPEPTSLEKLLMSARMRHGVRAPVRSNEASPTYDHDALVVHLRVMCVLFLAPALLFAMVYTLKL